MSKRQFCISFFLLLIPSIFTGFLLTNKVYHIRFNIPIATIISPTNNIINTPSIKRINLACQEDCAKSIPVLTYHHFLTKQDLKRSINNGKYTMDIATFEKQMKYLYDNNYQSLDSQTFIDWYDKRIEINKKNFMVTFDDGNISAYYLAMPILEKYNFNGIFFVITSRIKNISNPWNYQGLNFLGQDLINDIKENHPLIELQSHTHALHYSDNNGSGITEHNKEEIYIDVKKSKDLLKATMIAYPFGKYNDNLLESVEKAGYDVGFIFEFRGRQATRKNNRYTLPRININAETSFARFTNFVKN